MSVTQLQRDTSNGRTVDMKLEVVVIPVSDVDRAKAFYASLGGGSMPTSPPAAITA